MHDGREVHNASSKKLFAALYNAGSAISIHSTMQCTVLPVCRWQHPSHH